jgi:hypothetical protein
MNSRNLSSIKLSIVGLQECQVIFVFDSAKMQRAHLPQPRRDALSFGNQDVITEAALRPPHGIS